MRTVTITVGTGAQGVTIGRRAENEATAVIFDVSALIETYGDGGAVLMVKRPTDADAYPATVERSGASVTWTPTETDLAYKGMGEAELFWYVDGMLAKTAVYTINIRRDIGETTGEAPAPYDDWIATLTELGGQTAENAQRAEVARAAAETAAATATSAANTASTAAERAESAANNAEQDAASTAADRTAAEDAATSASTSATAAATSAGAAETSAGQAAVSAQTAQSAVASIGDSVTRAESAASTATSAASTATTKAAEANTSAGVAASNATTATVKAQEAAQSATQAAQSATAAQTAQTAAESAQTGAQTAQTAAETAAASAEAQADRAEGYANRLTDFLPVDTASGSIASFSDGADNVEIKSAVVQIEPVQDLHGQSAPYPAGGGVNLLPQMVDGTYTGNGVTAVVKDGVATLSGTTTASGNALIIPLSEPVTVTDKMLYYHIENSAVNASVSPAIENSAQPGTQSISYSFSPANRITAISGKTGQTYDRIRFYLTSGITVSGTYAPMFCEDNTARAYVPYSNICPISGWDAVTVTGTGVNLFAINGVTYGKWCDNSGNISDATYGCISGWIFADSGTAYRIDCFGDTPYSNSIIEYDSNFNFIRRNHIVGERSNSITSSPSTRWIRLQFANGGSGTYTITEQILNSYKAVFTKGSTAPTAYIDYATTYPLTLPSTVYGGTLTYEGDGVWTVESRPYYASYAGETLVGPWVSSMDAYTPGGTPTTGAQVVDLGGTVTEYTLTTEQVVTLLGQNNIFADCGDISVTYRADIGLFIDKKLAALAAALS